MPDNTSTNINYITRKVNGLMSLLQSRIHTISVGLLSYDASKIKDECYIATNYVC